MEQEQLVPELRFSLFNDSWIKYKLDSKVIKIGSGSTPNGGENAYSKKGVPFIRSQNVNNNKLILDEIKYISEVIDRKMANSRFYPFDILLNITGGSIGRSCVVPENCQIGNLNQHVCIIRLKKDNETFIQSYLSSWFGKKLIHEGMTGSGREGLNFHSIRQFRLPFPSLPEQQKIADFLTAVDRKIQALTRKVELLKDYKKGVMQKIFKQEIRFKDEDGGEFEDWEEKNLSYYLKVSNEKNLELRYSKNDVLSVSGEFGIVNQIEFQGRSFAGASVHNYGFVDFGDIVYTKSPLKSNPYGIIKVNEGKPGIVSTLYAVYKVKEKVANGKYLEYYFQLDDNTNRYLRPLVRKGAKNDMKINNEHVLSDPIIAPSIEEQNKIVNYLKVIDNKIRSSENQLDKLKEWKKGLLQKMFV